MFLSWRSATRSTVDVSSIAQQMDTSHGLHSNHRHPSKPIPCSTVTRNTKLKNIRNIHSHRYSAPHAFIPSLSLAATIPAANTPADGVATHSTHSCACRYTHAKPHCDLAAKQHIKRNVAHLASASSCMDAEHPQQGRLNHVNIRPLWVRMPPIPLAALLQHRHLNGRHPFAHRKWRCITTMHCPTHRAAQRQRNPHRGNFAIETLGAAKP